MRHLLFAFFVLSGAASADEIAPSVKAGDLTLSAPFARATLPNQPVAGLYLTISNAGETEDVLIGASAGFAARGEIHEMSMDGDTMRMRPLPDGVALAPGETVTLAPGGLHLMFMGLTEPLELGGTVEATLVFREAGEVTVMFPVLSPGATSGVGE